MLVIFCVCISVIAYVYFGYPALLSSGVLGKRRPIKKQRLRQHVSVIIPAHNEAETIGAKLDNLASQDYPSGLIEVLVGNDGSTDDTVKVLENHRKLNLRIVDHPTQRGKSAIQNDLVPRASGEILVFTDSDCLLSKQAISCIVENFADASVGLVTAQPRYVSNAGTLAENEGLYWRYESWLRNEESDRGVLAMASGSLFAMRRCLWTELPKNQGDDFVLPLRVALGGYRNVVEPRCEVTTILKRDDAETLLGMKKRIVSKDLRGLLSNWRSLNPFETGATAIGLMSHKLLRWFVPYFFLGLLVSTFVMAKQPIFRSLLAFQLILYAAAMLGAFPSIRRCSRLASVPFSFLVVNLAALIGTAHCLSGRSAGQWRTVR